MSLPIKLNAAPKNLGGNLLEDRDLFRNIAKDPNCKVLCRKCENDSSSLGRVSDLPFGLFGDLQLASKRLCQANPALVKTGLMDQKFHGLAAKAPRERLLPSRWAFY